MKVRSRRVLVDFLGIAVSIAVAVALVKTGEVHALAASFHELNILGSFFAGMLFTSVFTTAPAIAILGELSQMNSLYAVALLGALGAMVGDYLIFRFVRNRFADDIRFLLRHSTIIRIPALCKARVFRFVTPVIGALIIASPLPDEMGIAMLGFSKLSTRAFLLISFIFNAVGIVIIGLLANSTLW